MEGLAKYCKPVIRDMVKDGLLVSDGPVLAIAGRGIPRIVRNSSRSIIEVQKGDEASFDVLSTGM